MRIHIYELTTPELNALRSLCNFTEEELEYFNLKAKNKTNVQVSMTMNVSISKVSCIAKRVTNKINKIKKEVLT